VIECKHEIQKLVRLIYASFYIYPELGDVAMRRRVFIETEQVTLRPNKI